MMISFHAWTTPVNFPTPLPGVQITCEMSTRPVFPLTARRNDSKMVKNQYFGKRKLRILLCIIAAHFYCKTHKLIYNPDQIFCARAIGLNTSRDAAKIGEYQIFPSFGTLRFTFARLAFIPSKLLKWIKLNTLSRLRLKTLSRFYLTFKSFEKRSPKMRPSKKKIFEG